MTATPRPYGGPQDTVRMRSFLVSLRSSIGHGCWHVGDLSWRLWLHSIRYDLADTVHLWEDGAGRLLGFSVVTPPSPEHRSQKRTLYFDLQIGAQECGGDLAGRMLDWLATLASSLAEPNTSLCTDTGVPAGDQCLAGALRRWGFSRREEPGLLLGRTLEAPLPAPMPVPGFVVDSMAAANDISQRAAAHRDAFHPSRLTNEAYHRLTRDSGYEAELDLCAVAPDGTVGAFCIAWMDRVNRVGEFEPVGTRAALRRQGLARAVLLEGLRRMKAAGADVALVGPLTSGDRAALQLYTSLGFRLFDTFYHYSTEP
jgi:mycothiol synthase